MMQTMQFGQGFLVLMGVLCILAPSHIVKILPYVMGLSMALMGGVSLGAWSRSRKTGPAATDLAHGLVLLIVGISFSFQGENALLPMGIVWAIIGIRKASKTLIRLIAAVDEKRPCWCLAIEFFLRILLALILLFDPYGKFSPHLRILGAELIVNNLQPRRQARKLGPGDKGED